MRKNTKKLFALASITALMLSMAGCGGGRPATDGASESTDTNTSTTASTDVPSSDSSELTVFAAASMTETLTQLGESYMDSHPGTSITFNFDSSGTLETQILEGAECDIFISAAQKQMNELDITSDEATNSDRNDYVLEGTRIDLLENKVVLCTSDTSNANINSFDALAEQLKEGNILMAMGNEDVPVGQYTQKILTYYDLSKEELANAGVLTYGTNVKEVTSQITEGAVDCGVIYATDAYSANLPVVDEATAPMCGQVIYPAAVLNIAQNVDLAKDFLEYITEDEADHVFESVGFTAIGE